MAAGVTVGVRGAVGGRPPGPLAGRARGRAVPALSRRARAPADRRARQRAGGDPDRPRPETRIPLPWDREVSRVHALLQRVAGAWTILDDGLSRNGTLVNGERLAGRRRLRDRDVVRCGDVQIEFREPRRPRARRPPRAPRRRRSPARLTPAQRRVLVALCRPLREPGHAHPGDEQGDRGRAVAQRRRGEDPPAPARGAARGRGPAAEPQARAAGVERAQLGTRERARATRADGQGPSLPWSPCSLSQRRIAVERLLLVERPQDRRAAELARDGRA